MAQVFPMCYTMHFRSNRMGIPYIEPITEEPKIDTWIGINYVLTYKGDKKTTGVHFYVDDYQFERIWNDPKRWCSILKDFGCVVMPDFSTYLDFPFPVNLYNVYRNHWLGALWQKLGIKVYPCVLSTDEQSRTWCFDAMPKHSILAVSNKGVTKSKEWLEEFVNEYDSLQKKLEPTKVFVFGNNVEGLYGNYEVIEISGYKHDAESCKNIDIAIK